MTDNWVVPGDQSKEEMMEKITDNIYVETEYEGSNVGFVVTAEGVVMIDTPQVPSDAIAWRNEIRKHGPVRYLINTEPHIDHFAGNSFFDGIVIGHEGTRDAISKTQVEPLRDRIKEISPESLPLLVEFGFHPPDITLSERLSFYLGGHTFHLINMPGHTPFEVLVFIPEERVAFTGDNVIGKGHAFFPPGALPYKWMDSLKDMQELEADTFVPGHGTVCDPDYLNEMRAQIQDRLDRVKAAIDKGMSLEEAQDKIDFKDKYSEPSGPTGMALMFQRISIATLYGILQAK